MTTIYIKDTHILIKEREIPEKDGFKIVAKLSYSYEAIETALPATKISPTTTTTIESDDKIEISIKTKPSPLIETSPPVGEVSYKDAVGSTENSYFATSPHNNNEWVEPKPKAKSNKTHYIYFRRSDFLNDDTVDEKDINDELFVYDKENPKSKKKENRVGLCTKVIGGPTPCKKHCRNLKTNQPYDTAIDMIQYEIEIDNNPDYKYNIIKDSVLSTSRDYQLNNSFRHVVILSKV